MRLEPRIYISEIIHFHLIGEKYSVALLDFLKWSADTYSPDELVWGTLTRVPGSPGFRDFHEKWDQNELQTVTRVVKWAGLGHVLKRD